MNEREAKGDLEPGGIMNRLLQGEGRKEAVASLVIADVIGGDDQPPISRVRELLRANLLPQDGIISPSESRGWDNERGHSGDEDFVKRYLDDAVIDFCTRCAKIRPFPGSIRYVALSLKEGRFIQAPE